MTLSGPTRLAGPYKGKGTLGKDPQSLPRRGRDTERGLSCFAKARLRAKVLPSGLQMKNPTPHTPYTSTSRPPSWCDRRNPAMIRTDFRASRAGEVLSVPLAMLSTISR